MKLGFVSAILPEYSFQQLIEYTAGLGMDCVEVACWPCGKAERRYAGVTHINVDEVNAGSAAEIKQILADNKVQISGLAFYPNTLDPNLEARAVIIEHLKKVIKAAPLLGVEIVNTFIGKMPKATPDENWAAFKAVWPDIIKLAEDNGVTVCIENCPMYFSMDEWPGGKNLASNPKFWSDMFNEIPSDNFALNYDPSHQVLQRMDYVRPIYDFASKIKHFHVKDVKFYQDKFEQVGFLATPLSYHSPKLPGQGDIEWGKVISALNDIRYKGSVVIEVEDRAYEDTLDDRLLSIELCKRFMDNFIVVK